MNLYDVLYPDVVPQVPLCPDVVIKRAILYAVRSVLTTFHIGRMELDSFPVLDEVPDYVVDLPGDVGEYRVVKVFRVRVDGVEIDHMDRNAQQLKGAGPGYFLDQDHILYLTPAVPRGWLTMEVALAPSVDSGKVEFLDRLVQDFEDLFLAATLARLYSMDNVPWSNPEKAAYLQAGLAASVESARALTRGRNAPRRRTVKYGGY